VNGNRYLDWLALQAIGPKAWNAGFETVVAEPF
jgi:hypothetical protein